MTACGSAWHAKHVPPMRSNQGTPGERLGVELDEVHFTLSTSGPQKCRRSCLSHIFTWYQSHLPLVRLRPKKRPNRSIFWKNLATSCHVSPPKSIRNTEPIWPFRDTDRETTDLSKHLPKWCKHVQTLNGKFYEILITTWVLGPVPPRKIPS